MKLFAHFSHVVMISPLLLLLVCIACGTEHEDSREKAPASQDDATKQDGPSTPQPNRAPDANQQKKPKSNEANKKAPKPAQTIVTWAQAVEADKLGIPPSSKVNGQSLNAVIESKVPGRDDGQLCSACHNKTEAAGGYGVDMEKNGSMAPISQWDLVGTEKKLPWGGKVGWANRFLKNSTKPESLKKVMRAWLESGCN